MKKSIMDAIDPVRKLLKDASLHNFDDQPQGPEHKVMLPTWAVAPLKANGISTNALNVAGKVLKS